MLPDNLRDLIELVNDAEKRQEGIWVRLENELKICLIKVADHEKFVAKFFPCAKNSRTYEIPYAKVWKVETEPSTKAPQRYVQRDASAIDHSP
jgi:hypothetical protein